MSSVDVEVRLLGPVEVVVDGSPVDLGGLRQRLILARLALGVGRPVPVQELLELLWPGDLPASAVANLQSYVSRVRRRVGSSVVVKEPGGYRLVLDRAQIDAARVEDAIAEAATCDVERRLVLLDEAVTAWRGSSLADVSDWVGLMGSAARLDDLRVVAIEQWAEAMMTTGKPGAVVPAVEEAATTAPDRESLQVVWMRALDRVGRTAEALRIGHDYRRRLAETTGLEPGSRFVEVEGRLLHSEPTPQPTRPRRRRYAVTDSFVGRDGDFARALAQSAGPGLITLVGPGGIGKTRLLTHLLDAVDPDGRPVELVELGPLPAGEDDLVEGQVASALGLTAAGESTVAAIADRLDPAVLLALNNCEHVLDGVRALVRGIAIARPDVTVVATSRQRLSLPAERLVELDSLDVGAAVELYLDRVRAERPGMIVDDDIRRAAAEIVELVDRVPLAIEMAAGRERLMGTAQLRDRLQAARRASDQAPPSPVHLASTVRWSYELLPAGPQHLFTATAVIPGSFSLDVVETVHGPGTVADLGALVDANLVMVDRAEEPPRYHLHALVGQAGRELLADDERAAVRDRLCTWTEGIVSAARRAQDRRVAGPTTVLRQEAPLIQAAIGWLADTGEAQRAADLAVEASLLLTDAPDAAWLAQLDRLVESNGSGDVGEAAGVWALVAAATSWIRGRHDEATAQLGIARSSLDPGHRWRWYLDFLTVTATMYAGRANAIERAARATHANSEAPAFIRATAVCCAALVRHYTGDTDQAQRWLDYDPDLLAEVGRVDGFVPFTRAELAAAEDLEQAVRQLDEAVRLCRTAGHAYNRRVAEIARLAALIRLGRGADAAGNAAPLLASCHRAGMWPQVWIVTRLVAELLVDTGQGWTAAVLLAAADADSAAPEIMGGDAVRRSAIDERITHALGPSRAIAAADEGRRLTRPDLLERVQHALGEVVR